MIDVIDVGEGHAVMLLHGAPSPVADFAPLITELRRDHRVLAPHLPGYGKTPALDGPYTFARVYDLLEAMLLERGISELAIVGFSLGAHHALALASSTRVRVTCVVSIAGFAALTPADQDAMHGFTAMLSAPGASLTTPEMRDLVRQRFLAPAYAADPRLAREVEAWTTVVSPAVLAAELDAETQTDLRPQLAKLAIPVLARVGALDVAVPCAYSEEIAALCPQGRLEIVQGHGHALLLEQPDETIASICAALR